MEENIGLKFGRLTVIEYEFTDKHYYKHYRCLCDCGKEKVISINSLRSGRTKSCGCYKKQCSIERNTKHNDFVIDVKNNLVVFKTTNTNKEFWVDLEDFEKVKNISWYEASTGYIHHKDRNKHVIQLHRFVTNCPKNKVVDHKNHNIKDNRKMNLRVCTQKENSANRIRL